MDGVSCCGKKQKGNEGVSTVGVVIIVVFVVGGCEVNVSPKHPADSQGGNNPSKMSACRSL